MNPTPTAGLNDVLENLTPAGCAAVLEHTFNLVAILELPTMRLQYLNAPGRGLLEVGRKESLADIAWADLVSPGTAQAMRVHGQRSIAAGRAWRGTGVLRTRSGVEIPVRLGMAVTSSADAVPALALVTAIDDTRLLNMQTVLRNEQLLLHALFSTLPDSIYFKDLESRFIRGGAAHARKLGALGPEDIVGQTDADYFSAEHAQQALTDEKRIIATAEPMLNVEEKETWPDGREAWVSTSKFPMRDWHGAIVGTFGISHDITARKRNEAERQRLEQQLFLAQKMESIGRLAAGVAHEINTPTQYIADNTHFLVGASRQIATVCAAYRQLLGQARAHPDCAAAVAAVAAAETEAELDYLLEEIPRTLEQTIDGISRVARIVHSMRDYSHQSAPEKLPAQVNQAVESAVAVSRHEWKLVAEVLTELDRDLPLVPCVRDEINQVVLNLLLNATHAITDVVADRPGERGRITLRTRRDDKWAVIEVEDTGGGIPESVGRHIFEPFFTTKPVGQGTGQGLALVHTVVVTHHQGTVNFTTEVGRGTTFCIRLPLHPDAAAPGTPAAAESAHEPLSP